MGYMFKPTIGNCMKCETENSELFEYKPGWWICKANACWTEEAERDSGEHLIKNKKRQDYDRLIAGTQ